MKETTHIKLQNQFSALEVNSQGQMEDHLFSDCHAIETQRQPQPQLQPQRQQQLQPQRQSQKPPVPLLEILKAKTKTQQQNQHQTMNKQQQRGNKTCKGDGTTCQCDRHKMERKKPNIVPGEILYSQAVKQVKKNNNCCRQYVQKHTCKRF